MCGAGITTQHLQKCIAIKEQWCFCGGADHFANRGRMGEINLIDQSEHITEEDAENNVLQLGGNGTPPFVLSGK